jgi:hypothetical protein
MAKKQIYIVRESDGWLASFQHKKDMINYLNDATDFGNDTKGIQVAEYELIGTIPVKSLIKKEAE